MPFTFHIASDLAIVGSEPEMADFDNPRGDIIREVYFMVAEDEDGRQFRCGRFATPEAVEDHFVHVAPPVAEWDMFRCVYGSRAYDFEGCELEQIYLEKEAV